MFSFTHSKDMIETHKLNKSSAVAANRRYAFVRKLFIICSTDMVQFSL